MSLTPEKIKEGEKMFDTIMKYLFSKIMERMIVYGETLEVAAMQIINEDTESK